MKKLYQDLYKKIYKIRSVEKKISEMYKHQEIRCPVHLSIGQEAVAAMLSVLDPVKVSSK